MNNKLKGLLKDTMIFALGSFGSKIILFFMVPLYTNYLTKPEYGIAEYVFTIANLLVPIFSISIWEGVTRMGLKSGVKKENVLFNSITVFGACSALIVLLTPAWNLYRDISPYKVYLSAYAIVYILNQIEMNYLKVKDNNKMFALATVLQTAILAVLNVVLLVKLRLGVRGYLIANVAAVAAADGFIFLAGRLYRDLRLGRFEMPLMRQMLVYSAPLIVNNISWWVIHSSDKIMIKEMLTAGELGLYTAASKIPSLINVFVTIFTQAWGISSIKEMESTNDSEYYSQVFELYSVFLVGCMVFLTAIMKPFMSVYVGKEFVEAWRFVPLLLLAAVFQAFSAYFGSLLGALQNSVHTMTTTMIGGVANIVLNFVLIRLVGVWGAIIGTLSAFVIITAIRKGIVSRKIQFTNSWGKFAVNALLCLAHACLVSMDFHIVLVSVVVIGVFLAINYKTIWSILQSLLRIAYKINKK